MEHLDQFNRNLIGVLAAMAIAFVTSLSVSASADVKPACFRLEGLRMQCTGGGGVGCTETCDPAQQALTCEGYGICGGQIQCQGTKCDCSCHPSNACGPFEITCNDGTKKTCQGTTQPVDCSALPKTCPVYKVIQGTVCTSGQCVGTKSPYTNCSANNPQIDGCQCSCQTSGDDCIAQSTGACGGACSCSKDSGIVCGTMGYTIPTTSSCVIDTGELEAPQQISPCACACAGRPAGASCSSDCQDTSNQCPFGPGAGCN